MILIAVIAAILYCTIVSAVVFRKSPGMITLCCAAACAAVYISFTLTLDAPTHMYDNDYCYYCRAEAVLSDADLETHFTENESFNQYNFVFLPSLKLFGQDFDSLIKTSRILYIIAVPVVIMCSWLLFESAFASIASGLLFLISPLFIRYAGGVTFVLPAVVIYMNSVLFLLLFIKRRNPVLLALSVSLLAFASCLKQESIFFIPAYYFLAWWQLKQISNDSSKKVSILSVLIAVVSGITAIYVLFPEFFKLHTEEFVITIVSHFEKKSPAAPASEGSSFLSGLITYAGMHLFLIPPVIAAKIALILSLFIRSVRVKILPLAFHALIFIGIFSFAENPGLNQFRYAMHLTFPILLTTGVYLEHIKQNKILLTVMILLMAANMIPHYMYINDFKNTFKFREYTFLTQETRDTDDCTILYDEYSNTGMTPACAAGALKPIDTKLDTIQSRLIPGSPIDIALKLSFLQFIAYQNCNDGNIDCFYNRLDISNPDSIKAFITEFRSALPDIGKDERVTDSLKTIETNIYEYRHTPLSYVSSSLNWTDDFQYELENDSCIILFHRSLTEMPQKPFYRKTWSIANRKPIWQEAPSVLDYYLLLDKSKQLDYSNDSIHAASTMLWDIKGIKVGE